MVTCLISCGVLSKDESYYREEEMFRSLLSVLSFCRRKIILAIKLGVSNQFLIQAALVKRMYSCHVNIITS